MTFIVIKNIWIGHDFKQSRTKGHNFVNVGEVMVFNFAQHLIILIFKASFAKISERVSELLS